MKKLLSLFCAIIALSGCSALSESSLFGGSECESKMARDFMEHAEDRVFFAFDSSAISADSAEILNTQVKWLKKHHNVNVVVQGYCDERGTREYNLALGERRANAAKQYLVSQGIPINVVKDLVGHDSSDTTELYNDIPKKEGFLKYFSSSGEIIKKDNKNFSEI